MPESVIQAAFFSSLLDPPLRLDVQFAVPVGTGGGSWSSSMVTDTIPEARIPQATNSIFVFALP
jgi:hypothetical protein